MVVLEITSLLDFFVIILVFLLMSFHGEAHNFVLKAGLDLPGGAATSALEDAVNIAITEDAIFVDGEKVYTLRDNSMPLKTDLQSEKITSLVRALEAASEPRESRSGGDTVLIQASKKIPYRTLHTVMTSAQRTGLVRFRLALERE